MKKIITTTILSICIIFFTAQKPSVEKKYKFEFSPQELNVVWNCLDNSTAPHDQVKAVQGLIQQQLISQTDTTKK